MSLSRPVSLKANLMCGNDPHCDTFATPRSSSPMSFLSLRAFMTAMLMMVVSFACLGGVVVVDAVGTGYLGPNDCVCDYNRSLDYFPVKSVATDATGFTIEYFKSYKKINISVDSLDGGTVHRVYYAYLCGTPIPQQGLANNTIRIPIQSAILSSTTYLPFVNYLGMRETVQMVQSSENYLSSCLKSLYQLGDLITYAWDYNHPYPDTAAFAVIKQYLQDSNFRDKAIPRNESQSVYFYGVYSSDDETYLLRNASNQVVPFFSGEDREDTTLGSVEWLKVFGALYNKELAANDVYSNIKARYECVKALVSNAPPVYRPKVLFGSIYYGTFYGTSCPNSICDMIRDAGGDVVAWPGSLNYTEFAKVMNRSDIFLLQDTNWDVTSAYDNPPIFSGVIGAYFANLKPVTSRKVFDVSRKYLPEYFDTRFAQPDVFLMDLIQMLHGTTYIASTRRKEFLRNVFSEAAVSQAPRVASACPDTSVPLYTDWLTGVCSTTGVPVSLENPTHLCLARNSANGVFMSILVAVSVAMVGVAVILV